MERNQLVDLVTRAQNGDGGAMDELFATYYNDVYYFALKTLKDSDTACDITQETFLEIINTIGNLKEPAAFVTWMKQITYHQCTRYFKKKKDVLVEEDEDGNTIFDTLADESEGAIPAEVYEKEEFRNTILSIINELTEEQRSAVMMYYFDEMSVSQIAGIQGVSEGTVKSRLNYARKALKKSVEAYEKKHDIKLHSFSFLPLFLLFFGKDLMPAAKAARIGTVVSKAAGAASAGAAVTGAATSGAGSAGSAAPAGLGAKIAAAPLATKIIAGVAAAALLVGGGVAALRPKESHHCQDLNGDCLCDGCGLGVHHFDGDDHIRCIQCGELFFNYDVEGDGICDLCGETPCGPAHQLPHEYAQGICRWCGAEEAPTPDGEEMDGVHQCVDADHDCTCDECAAGIHFINGEQYVGQVPHDSFCDYCGMSLGFADGDGDWVCDECGEFPCGQFHHDGHWGVEAEDLCGWCGEPAFEQTLIG